MAGKRKEKLPQTFRVSLPALHYLRFESFEKPVGARDDEEVSPVLNLEHSVARLGQVELGYELKVTIEFAGVLMVEAAYRARFMLPENGEEDDTETRLRHIAARNAPALLYPYARECIHSTLQRASPGPLALPVVNFAEVWDPKEIEIPPFQVSGEGVPEP